VSNPFADLSIKVSSAGTPIRKSLKDQELRLGRKGDEQAREEVEEQYDRLRKRKKTNPLNSSMDPNPHTRTILLN